MDANYYRFQLGNFECVSLLDAMVDYTLSSMFNNVPVTEVEDALRVRGFPTDVITTPYTYLYVNTGSNRILVDLGAGNLTPATGRLLQSLSAAGLKPEDIDSVFITHAHPDHVGGMLDAAGKVIFDRATYYIWRREWDFWFSEDAVKMAPMPMMIESARKNLTPIKDKIVLLDHEEENVLPGVGVLFAPGHTPGQMVVSFTSQEQRLLYTTDVVLHPLHLEHPNWLPVFDILRDEAQASKERIFDLVSSTGCRVVVQHFQPFPSLGHIHKKPVGWEWQPVSV